MLADAFIALMVVACGYAFIRGGAPERAGALIAAVGFLATLAMGRHRYAQVELDVLAIDLAVYAGFQLLALSADRFWPTLVAGLQLTTVLMHVATGAMPDFIPFAYALAIWAWSWIIMALIFVGTWRHRRRLSRYGADRDWSSSPMAVLGATVRG